MLKRIILTLQIFSFSLTANIPAFRINPSPLVRHSDQVLRPLLSLRKYTCQDHFDLSLTGLWTTKTSCLVMRPLLDPYQSAHLRNQSTSTALLNIRNDILDSIDDPEIALLMFLDFSKAFDTVNHRILVEN